MSRKSKPITFADGTVIYVREASSADMDDAAELAEDAATAEYKDADIALLARTYYPILTACSDKALELTKVYKLDSNDLDNYWLLACQMNPAWLTLPKYTEKTVPLADKKKIIVKSIRPSVSLRLAKLQQDTPNETPLKRAKDEEYRTTAYPGAAACSFGDVPTAYEAKHELSASEFAMWHKTVQEIVPEWYATDAQLEQSAKADEVAEKKSANQPVES